MEFNRMYWIEVNGKVISETFGNYQAARDAIDEINSDLGLSLNCFNVESI